MILKILMVNTRLKALKMNHLVLNLLQEFIKQLYHKESKKVYKKLLKNKP